MLLAYNLAHPVAISLEARIVVTTGINPLKESLKYASVQISTANANGELYVWGYIPVVVAKSCVPFTLTFAII